MKLFVTGFLQVFFVAINTYCVAHKMFLGTFMAAFTISFVWSFNVKRAAFGGKKDILIYCTGAGFGSLVGLWVSTKFF